MIAFILIMLINHPVYFYIHVTVIITTYNLLEEHVWHDEEKGYNARDLVISKPCRAENYLSNDIKYVRIGQILTKLQSSEHYSRDPKK